MRPTVIQCTAIAVLLAIAQICCAEDTSDSRGQRLIAGAKEVIAAISEQSKSMRVPSANDGSAQGDFVIEQYVRAAAKAASQLPDDVSADAFLVGLAIACDHSDALRKVPLVGKFVGQVENSQERKQRLSKMKKPTLLGRDDLAQHFVVSAYLTSRLGAAAADAAGLAKELKDANGGSGFSFADMLADKAGVQFAMRVLAKEIALADLATSFTMQDYMPRIEGLEEGLAMTAFEQRYGTTTDDRFQAVMKDIDQRLQQLYESKSAAEDHNAEPE